MTCSSSAPGIRSVIENYIVPGAAHSADDGEIAAFVGDQTHHAGLRLSGIKRRRSTELLRELVSPRRTGVPPECQLRRAWGKPVEGLFHPRLRRACERSIPPESAFRELPACPT